MEEAPLGWIWVDKRQCYVCMCGVGVDYVSECKYHISEEVRGGYCENGFRAVSETHYECVCGKKFQTTKLAWEHRRDVFNTCINEAKYKEKAYCSKCELQFKTPYALDQHLLSKRHIDGDGPVIKHLHCKECDIECKGQKQMKAHLETAKHKQILDHGKIDLSCGVCGITCRGQKQMLAHLETNKHKKKLDQNELTTNV
jgi:hypothetical protein